MFTAWCRGVVEFDLADLEVKKASAHVARSDDLPHDNEKGATVEEIEEGEAENRMVRDNRNLEAYLPMTLCIISLKPSLLLKVRGGIGEVSF
eukprot:SAG11_NODE_8710_length_985_cov_0.955982_2_plen_92_part_00